MILDKILEEKRSKSLAVSPVHQSVSWKPPQTTRLSRSTSRQHSQESTSVCRP